MSGRTIRSNTNNPTSPAWLVAVVLAAVTALGMPANALAEVNDGSPEGSVMFGATGIASLDRSANARALVVLDDLRLADRMSARAERSVIPVEFQENNRQHLGVLLPANASVESVAWSKAPLIIVEDARKTVTFGDAADGPFVMAGYFLPTDSEPERRPWLQASFGDGGPINAEFRVRSRTQETKGMVLREVAGMDSKQVYFLANGPGGEGRLVVATYSISRLPDRVSP